MCAQVEFAGWTLNGLRRVKSKNGLQFQYATTHTLRSEADPSPNFHSIKLEIIIPEHLCPLGDIEQCTP